MSVAEAMALRVERGWSSCLPPMSPGEMSLMWSSPGMVEFMVATDDAPAVLERGVRLNDQPHPVEVVDELPLMNAVIVRAWGPFRGV